MTPLSREGLLPLHDLWRPANIKRDEGLLSRAFPRVEKLLEEAIWNNICTSGSLEEQHWHGFARHWCTASGLLSVWRNNDHCKKHMYLLGANGVVCLKRWLLCVCWYLLWLINNEKCLCTSWNTERVQSVNPAGAGVSSHLPLGGGANIAPPPT